MQATFKCKRNANERLCIHRDIIMFSQDTHSPFATLALFLTGMGAQQEQQQQHTKEQEQNVVALSPILST